MFRDKQILPNDLEFTDSINFCLYATMITPWIVLS